MYVVLGATGHIGSVLTSALLARGERVTVVTHREEQRAELEARGARVAVLDVRDVDALGSVFRAAKRAFLLNPPAPPQSEDAAGEERETVAAIIASLRDSRLEGVFAYLQDPLTRTQA
jgi:uncharacterized protein YbjT (DUF2867 family)